MHVPLFAFGLFGWLKLALTNSWGGARRGASGAALGMPGGYRSVEPLHQSSYIHCCFNAVDLDVVCSYEVMVSPIKIDCTLLLTGNTSWVQQFHRV